MQASEDTEDEFYDLRLIQVDAGQEPLRVDKYLTDRLPKLSRKKIQVGIKAGNVKINGKLVKPNYRVKGGDKIEYIIPENHGPSVIEPQEIPLDIVYEDADLLVVNKPAGMVVHPGFGNRDGTLINALLYHLEKLDLPLLKGNDSDRPGLVHRIDKDTSGLLVIAKNDFALSHLANQFFNHSTTRSYQALIWGELDENEGTYNAAIGRDPKNRTKFRVVTEDEKGKMAITHYSVIEPMYYVSLIKCSLETGRTHQIRVHFSNMGHPLFGDTKYGGAQIVKGTVFQKYKQFVSNCFKLMPHHALHAYTLGFDHPVTKERMQFTAPLPPYFEKVLLKWRNYVNTRKSSL